MANAATGWIILRTSGRHTMRLAASLTAGGYEAWTPIETRMVKVPRANLKREVQLPIMPSYVFARADRLIDLLHLKPPAHVDFSVMRHADHMIPVIADGALQGLRRIEAKRTPAKKSDRTYVPGVDVRVKVEGGSFAGMKGRVEKSDHGHSLICFDDRLTVKIATCLLVEDAVWASSSHDREDDRKAA